MTRLYTDTERKEASRQALALLTASNMDHPEHENLLTGLIPNADLPLVVVMMLSLVSGLLAGLDEDNRGAADRWLRHCGQSVEAMPEGGE